MQNGNKEAKILKMHKANGTSHFCETEIEPLTYNFVVFFAKKKLAPFAHRMIQNHKSIAKIYIINMQKFIL